MNTSSSLETKYKTQLKLFHTNPLPNLYICLEKDRFFFKKRVDSKILYKLVRLRKIQNETDFWNMVYDWMVYLDKNGDEDAKYWLHIERYKILLFSQHPDQDDYDGSPRQIKYFQLKMNDKYRDEM